MKEEIREKRKINRGKERRKEKRKYILFGEP